MSSNLYPRNGIFWARFKVAGIEYRESLRTRSEATAKKRLKALRQQIEDQARFGIAAPQSWQAAVVSWDEAMTAAIRTGAISPKTINRYKTSLRECRQWLDERMLHEIDAKLLRELVKARQLQRVTNATIRRDLTALSSVLEHAIAHEWIEENAAAAFPRKRIAERRDPIVLPTDDDIAFTLGDQPGRFADLVLFARETGMRQEEIADLEHREIDLRNRVVTFIGKRRKLRAVPLSPAAIEIIMRQPRNLLSPHVFWRMDEDAEGKPKPTRYTQVATNFRDYVRRATARAKKAERPYRPFRFHDLRHLFAVDYLRTGAGGIYDLQRILGHSSIKTTEIYLDYLTPAEATAARVGVAQKGAQTQRSGTND